jgi:hypothetical protein
MTLFVSCSACARSPVVTIIHTHPESFTLWELTPHRLSSCSSMFFSHVKFLCDVWCLGRWSSWSRRVVPWPLVVLVTTCGALAAGRLGHLVRVASSVLCLFNDSTFKHLVAVTCAHAFMYARVLVCVCILCTCICTFVYIYIYIYIYTRKLAIFVTHVLVAVRNAQAALCARCARPSALQKR